MSINITLSLSKVKYPILDKLKAKDLKKITETIFENGYNLLYPSINQSKLLELQTDNNKYALITELISESATLVCDKIEETDINDKLDNLNITLDKLFGVSYTSSKKGELSENFIQKIFEEKYPDMCYEVTRQVGHNGDAIIKLDDVKIMLEIKNYTYTVNKDEITKFDYDMKYQNINYGIFFSLQTSIQGCSNFDIKQFYDNDTKYVQIYVGCLNQNFSKIDAAIILMKQLIKLDYDCDSLSIYRKQIYKYVEELNSLYSINKKLRDSFYKMESSVKDALSDFYTELRDNQIDIEQKITDFNSQINSTSVILTSTNILKELKTKKYWGVSLLSVLLDNLEKKNVKLELIDNIYTLNKKNKMIGELKLQNNKFIVQLLDPHIALTFDKKSKSNDNNIKTINIIL
jgi:hypothetical protein